MEITALTERLKYSLRKKDVQQLAHFFCEHPDGVSLLFEISTSNNKELAFHAAWVLENCLLADKNLLEVYVPLLLKSIPELRNSSVRRHFCKILKVWLVQDDRNLQKLVREYNEDVEALVETCYDWLLDAKVPVAVKAHCLEIFFVLSRHFNWLRNELPNIFRLVQINSSPGVRAMVHRLNKNLELGNET
ncbi:MAG: hypothetical protein PWR03_307 [Tenuifilum sp.]|jgi:hypothetical protein|uniref:hypothetical protein n=1 Tax=Tenuifilum sp. TaxID=2760880 RepID=UPI0024ABA1DB|nr:hypothetical protein [Tenuifilum sp.]MDI3526124.1 hypothetical protein [Tenuifilum sp.]